MILLDTHIWIWSWQNVAKLSQPQARMIQSPQETISVSSISLWETAMLVEKGRLHVRQPLDQWLSALLRLERLTRFDITIDIAVESAELPGHFHKDPADRLIVSTARVLNCPLMTADQQRLDYPHVSTIE